MATYAEVQAAILNDMHRSDLTAEVQTAMSNAIERLRMERFWFNETQVSFTATLTADYLIGTVLPKLLEVDSLRVWHNGTPTEIDRAHWVDLNSYDETLVNGTPSSWAVHHRLLRIYPTPNETMSIEVVGLKELSTSAWCSYAPLLVRSTAEVELYGMVTHDMTGAQRAAEMARVTGDALRRRSPTMAADGEVRGYL